MDPSLRQVAQDGDIDAFYRLVGTNPSILEQIDERSSFVETPLHVAASLGHTEFAMEMMRLKPSFARKPNQDGFTPIHLALQNHNISQQQQLVVHQELVVQREQLIVQQQQLVVQQEQLVEQQQQLVVQQEQLVVQQQLMEQQQQLVVQQQQLVVQQEQLVVQQHLVEQQQLVLEHLVQQQVVLEQLVLSLLQVEPDLVRLKGREGETPLHYVARKGNLDLLAEFLLVCPDSIKDVTIRSETALHIAIKYNKVEAFEVLLGWLNRAAYDNTLGLRETIVNWKNYEGNTALHIATSNNLPQVMVVALLIRSRAAVNEKNLSGLTVLDILYERPPLGYQEIRAMLHRSGALRASAVDTKSIWFPHYLRASVPFTESVLKYVFRLTFYMPSDKRNAFLVVAVLIATATYQAGLSPPGGVWQDNYNPPPPDLNTTTITPSSSSPPPHHVGTTVLPPEPFIAVSVFNTLAFCLSMAIIFILLPIGPGGVGLRSTIGLLYYSYVCSIIFISPGRTGWIASSLICISIIILMFWHAATKMFVRETHRSPGDRRIGILLVPRMRNELDVDG